MPESPLAGLYREVAEETGLEGLLVQRKLGVRRYYKEYTRSDVERHDYLLQPPASVPLEFCHTVTGHGGDAGEVFEYRWIGPDEVDTVAPEFQQELSPEYLPELFSASPGDVNTAIGSSTAPEQVVVADYDPSWPRRFEDQRTLLEEVFGTDARIEHIGSTAVPGLSAKPVLDIMVGLFALSEAEAKVRELAWLGYDYVPDREAELPERRYFRQYGDGRRSAHLHCVIRGSADWRQNIAFRDVLRHDAALAADYVALKRSLAAQHRSDRVAYTNAKGPFIRAVLESAGFSVKERDAR